MRVARAYSWSLSGVYHVFDRGVDKRVVFHDDFDRSRFVIRLKKYAAEQSVTILVRCLMPNHFHLMVRADSIKQLSVVMQKLLTAYAVYYNRRYERTGHVFQGRFQSRAVNTEGYYQQLIRYIQENPKDDPLGLQWLEISGTDLPQAR